jgi:hypothetical protein
MTHYFRLLALVLAVLGSPLPVPAVAIYATGFENPPFAPGSLLVAQDGWVGVSTPNLSPNAAVISTALPFSGLQSVRVRGSDLESAALTPVLDAVGSYWIPVNYDAHGQVVRVEADVRLDGPVLGSGDLFSANIAAISGIGAVGELSLSSDGSLIGYTGRGTGQLFIKPVRLNEWHRLVIEVDFSARAYAFWVDDPFLYWFPFGADQTSDVLLRGSMVVYARPDGFLPGFQRSAFTAYYDNFSITTSAVPEPGSLTLCGVAVAGLLGFGWYRRGKTTCAPVTAARRG